jgi:hypothetical protein
MAIGLLSLKTTAEITAPAVWKPQNGDNPQNKPTPKDAALTNGGSLERSTTSRIICLKFFF